MEHSRDRPQPASAARFALPAVEALPLSSPRISRDLSARMLRESDAGERRQTGRRDRRRDGRGMCCELSAARRPPGVFDRSRRARARRLVWQCRRPERLVGDAGVDAGGDVEGARLAVRPARAVVIALALPAGHRTVARSLYPRRHARQSPCPGPRIAAAGRRDVRGIDAAGPRCRGRGSRPSPRSSLRLSLATGPGKGAPRLGIAARERGRNRRIRRR